MRCQLNKSLVLVFIVGLVMNFLLVPALPVAAAEDDGDILSTLGQAGQGMEQTAGQGDIEPKYNFFTIVGRVIKVILAILGIIFLILIVYAGILWMTASGETEDVQKAKRMIYQGIIGLLITVAAYAITFFIVENITAAVQE